MTNLPLPPNEQLRIEELRRYALLDTPPEKAFDDITRLAAQIFHTPIAAVTLIDQDRQWFKSCIGLETRVIGRNFAFCAHAILGTEVMVVPDARVDARFCDNPMVTGPPSIRFYAGAPLRTRNGLNLGTLTVSDTDPRQMTIESCATLTTLAALVVSEIERRYESGQHQRTTENLHLLQQAIEQSNEAVMITTAEVDLPGPEILFVNPAFTKLTGYAVEEVVGKTPRILQGPLSERETLDRVREQLTRREEFSFDSIKYRKDGSTFPASSRVSPIRSSNGEILHFISFQFDATKRNLVTSALREAKELAERANQAKSEFLSRMSHELRTPMHAILGYSQLLELVELTADDKESITHILRAGKHLLELINEVLDMARVEAGKLELTIETVGVRAALQESLDILRPMAAEKHVVLEPLTGELESAVLASPQHLRQIMLNLLSNAVKFNRPEGTVAVAVEKCGDKLRVKVIDRGLGINVQDLEKLFIPFERLGHRGGQIEGAGLGLALSRRLAEAMGGRVGVTSVSGEGSTFWLELPLASESVPSGRPVAHGLVAGGNHTSSSFPLTVLYVEDNRSNFRLMERILARRPGVRLVQAQAGAEGLTLQRELHPDLVLLDLHLPDLQGDEVLQQMRADPTCAQLPIIMISADATAGQIERLRGLGATDYLTKPIDVRQFLALIDAIQPRRLELAVV